MGEVVMLSRQVDSAMPQVPTPYPTALFIREKALVVNLESIRMIVSADQVSLEPFCRCFEHTHNLCCFEGG